VIHLAAAVASVWIPLAADLTPANAADNEQAPALIRELPLKVRRIFHKLRSRWGTSMSTSPAAEWQWAATVGTACRSCIP
jgi:hypothetical protein